MKTQGNDVISVDIPPHVNDIAPHLIHEIKTKVYDVIGINVTIRFQANVFHGNHSIDHYGKYHSTPYCSLFVTPIVCISIVFTFSWGHFTCNYQNELKIMLMQNFGEIDKEYRKIPKVSLGAHIFQRPFLRGLFLEGLVFGRAYLRREICVSKSIGLAL